ncbi:hypothetical protein BHE74_00028377 [Ensete ventricosum]|nr:hypothetical protein BHE74_00028377 [Ensete ventricosum]
MARHALAPCCCSRTSFVHVGHNPRDDKGSSSPRRPEGSTDRRSGRGQLRERQSTQEVSIPTDVGGLAHSDPLSPASLNCPKRRCTSICMSLGRRCNRKHPSQGRPKENTPAEHPTPYFRLPTLEPYDGSTDSMEHVATFRTQMDLYDTSDALMCRTFPTTLRGPARMWYSRIKPSSISSFDQFTKEFELNFIASSCLRPTTVYLLSHTQGNDEPLAQFVSRFSIEIRRMPDTHPTLAIVAFLMGLRPSRFFWSLIERPPSIVS